MSNETFDASLLEALGEIDKMIHEPARLQIIANLYVVESADFLFLMNQTGLTRGNLSSHLSKLEKAGYLDIKKEFIRKIPRTLLCLTQDGRKAFDSYRKRMQRVLDGLPEN
ncbi:transcriptional regulator [bacterium]|nr:transcriptional regulator [bacterium]